MKAYFIVGIVLAVLWLGLCIVGLNALSPGGLTAIDFVVSLIMAAPMFVAVGLHRTLKSPLAYMLDLTALACMGMMVWTYIDMLEYTDPQHGIVFIDYPIYAIVLILFETLAIRKFQQ